MKKLKGFTLLELVIVMAVFSIIMYSAVQLLDPVSKFFVRSSNFENTTACIDNLRRCIEGNLKYADRVRVFADSRPYTYDETDLTKSGAYQTVTPSAALLTNVKAFYDTYFADRKFLDISGSIYVLCFDNEEIIQQGDPNNAADKADLKKLVHYNKLGDYTNLKVNQGKLVLMRFEFDNYDTSKSSADAVAKIERDAGNKIVYPKIDVWSVNQKLYANFDYSFSMNALKDSAVSNAINNPIITTAATSSTSTTSATTATDINGSVITAPTPIISPIQTFNPQDFNIRITARQVRKTNNGLVRDATGVESVASFSMKNVLNAADAYRTAAIDYKPRLKSGASETAEHSYFVDQLPRYIDLQHGSDTGYNGFYFIFTNPDDILDVPDLPSQSAVYQQMLSNQQGLMSSTTL